MGNDEVEKITAELDELFGSSWANVHHRVLAREAAALLRRLREERDKARNKALDEAAATANECRKQNGPLAKRPLGDTYHDGIMAGAEAIAAAILALKTPA